jgi:hypothetical protein
MFHSMMNKYKILKCFFFYCFFSVILGTTSGSVILMDHHGNTTDGFSLSTQSITQLIYSCNKFYPGAPDNSKSYIYIYFFLKLFY